MIIRYITQFTFSDGTRKWSMRVGDSDIKITKIQFDNLKSLQKAYDIVEDKDVLRIIF